MVYYLKKIMYNYILHTKINSLTIIYLIILRLFSFNHLLLKLNSATGRDINKPNLIMRSIHLQLLDNKRRDCIF